MTGLFLCLLQYEGRRSAQLLGGTLTIDPTYTTGCRFVITLPENKQIGLKKVIS
jgi:hypothetical protein